MTFEEFIEEWHNSEDFIIVHTSGSTGVPKEIRLEKEFVRESGNRTNSFFNIKEGSRLHSCVAAEYIGGKMMAVRADIAGARFSSEKPTNQPLQDLLSTEIIDLLAVVPSQMLHIIANKNKLPEIRNIIVGGSAIHHRLRLKIAESGLNAYETYGMTETASHIALRKISPIETPFKLLPGIRIEKAVDECLVIHFESGKTLKTNDMVELISENDFFIRGRKDNVIISGGKKINPRELETKISFCIPSEFYLKGEPDERWGEKLVLMIEGNAEDFDEETLREEMGKILERWQVPKEIKYVEKLPRTGNGKIAFNDI